MERKISAENPVESSALIPARNTAIFRPKLEDGGHWLHANQTPQA
jgi:hypothetical protein